MRLSDIDTNSDQDQQEVRPVPDKACLNVRRGERVITLRGPGVVQDVILSLSEFADGVHQLVPPQVVVELDEPWDGEMLVTTYLHKCKVPGKGDVFLKACKRLWPSQVQDEPSVSLRPTETPTEKGKPMKISQRIKTAAGRERIVTANSRDPNKVADALLKGEKAIYTMRGESGGFSHAWQWLWEMLNDATGLSGDFYHDPKLTELKDKLYKLDDALMDAARYMGVAAKRIKKEHAENEKKRV